MKDIETFLSEGFISTKGNICAYALLLLFTLDFIYIHIYKLFFSFLVKSSTSPLTESQTVDIVVAPPKMYSYISASLSLVSLRTIDQFPSLICSSEGSSTRPWDIDQKYLKTITPQICLLFTLLALLQLSNAVMVYAMFEICNLVKDFLKFFGGL